MYCSTKFTFNIHVSFLISIIYLFVCLCCLSFNSQHGTHIYHRMEIISRLGVALVDFLTTVLQDYVYVHVNNLKMTENKLMINLLTLFHVYGCAVILLCSLMFDRKRGTVDCLICLLSCIEQHVLCVAILAYFCCIPKTKHTYKR